MQGCSLICVQEYPQHDACLQDTIMIEFEYAFAAAVAHLCMGSTASSGGWLGATSFGKRVHVW